MGEPGRCDVARSDALTSAVAALVDRLLTALGRKSGPRSLSRIVHRTMKRTPHDPDEPAARPHPGRRSRATLAEELQAELDGARVFQLFARRLGPSDVTYVSAMALDSRDRVVEVKATAMELGDALIQLFANLDQATTPAIAATDHAALVLAPRGRGRSGGRTSWPRLHDDRNRERLRAGGEFDEDAGATLTVGSAAAAPPTSAGDATPPLPHVYPQPADLGLGHVQARNARSPARGRRVWG